jgi:uncharacterized membrane protein
MSQGSMFAIEIAIIAVCFIAHIFRLTRRGMLSFRYSIGWFSIMFLGLLAAPFVVIFAPLAEKLKLTPSALLAVVVILIQLSVSISGNQRKMDTLVRENALLKEELDITLKDHKSDSTE